MEKIEMETKMSITQLVEYLITNQGKPESYALLQSNLGRLCREAHELEGLAGVLDHDALLNGGWDLHNLVTRVQKHATEAGVPMFELTLDGFGDSRDVAIRVTQELEKAWAEHATVVLNAHFRQGEAKKMMAWTWQDIRDDDDCLIDDILDEQTMTLTFAGPAILSVIESQMPEYITPDGDPNPAWLLYTILAGHRKTHLTPEEVNYLTGLSMDEKVASKVAYGLGSRASNYARKVLNEATARGLMAW
jgi:hypothetical protein